jgi:hypothetical protein
MSHNSGAGISVVAVMGAGSSFKIIDSVSTVVDRAKARVPVTSS